MIGSVGSGRLAVTWPRKLLLAVAWLAAIPCAAGGNVAVRNGRIYYIHPAAGLFVLNGGLQFERVVSLTGGPPHEIDADAVSGNAFVACGGGAAFVTAAATSSQWFPDDITTVTLLNTITHNHQGFTNVVVCDGGLAFFSHMSGYWQSSDMGGYIVTMPTTGGPLTNTQYPQVSQFQREFQSLLCDQALKRVFALSYTGYFTMYDGVSGNVVSRSHPGSFSLMDIWNGFLVQEGGRRYLGAAVLYDTHTPDGLNSHLELLDYDSQGMTPTTVTLNLSGTRPILYRDGHTFYGIALASPGNPYGIQVLDPTRQPCATFTTPSGVHSMAGSGSAVFGACADGVLVLSSTGREQTPTKLGFGQVPGIGSLVELSAGRVVGGGGGSGFSINGSADPWVAAIDSQGGVVRTNLKPHLMRLDAASPPVDSIDGSRRIQLIGANVTPDTRVYADVDGVARNRAVGIPDDRPLEWPASNVTYDGLGGVTATIPRIGFGPLDLVMTNNNGRQWASKNDAVVLQRAPLTLKQADFLIVDAEADPYGLQVKASEPGHDDGDAPGAIFHIRGASGAKTVMTMGARMYDPRDLKRDPLTGGWFMVIGNFGLGDLDGGESGVFGIDPETGFFSVERNLFSANEAYNIGQALSFTGGGRMFYLDSGSAIRRAPYDYIGIGVIYTIDSAGRPTPFAYSDQWNQPQTMALAPGGTLYALDGGDVLFGSLGRNWNPGIHAIDTAMAPPPEATLLTTSSLTTRLLLRDARLGFPLDCAVTPDGKLLIVSLHLAAANPAGHSALSAAMMPGALWPKASTVTHPFGNGAALQADASYSDIIEFDPTAEPEHALRTLFMPAGQNMILPTSLAMHGDTIYFVGGAMAGEALSWGIYQLDRQNPGNPVLLHAVQGLAQPKRLILLEKGSTAAGRQWPEYR